MEIPGNFDRFLPAFTNSVIKQIENVDVLKAQIEYLLKMFSDVYDNSDGQSENFRLYHICEYCKLPYCSTDRGYIVCKECGKFSCGGGNHCPKSCAHCSSKPP